MNQMDSSNGTFLLKTVPQKFHECRFPSNVRTINMNVVYQSDLAELGFGFGTIWQCDCGKIYELKWRPAHEDGYWKQISRRRLKKFRKSGKIL